METWQLECLIPLKFWFLLFTILGLLKLFILLFHHNSTIKCGFQLAQLVKSLMDE